MSAKNYQKALDLVLVHEGGFVDHPRDPGGTTNKGVTQRVYDLYREAKGLPQRSVRKLTMPECADIYRTRYWDVVKGDQLPAGVDYIVFDGAVNSGCAQSGKWLQRALGSHYKGKMDGQVGQSTLAAVQAHPDHDALVAAICQRRMAFLMALKTWSIFGKGWKRRVDDVRRIGLELAGKGAAKVAGGAAGDAAPKAVLVEQANAKGYIEDAPAKPWTAPADAATGGGLLTATIAQATDQLTPYAEIEFIGKMVALLTLAGVAMLIGGLAWRAVAAWRAKRRAEALELETAA